MKNKEKFRWQDLSVRKKLLMAFAVTSVLMFAINLFMYWQVNRSMKKIDKVYVSNINLNEFSDTFATLQSDIYTYLMVKSSSSLEDYYRNEQEYREKLEELNDRIVDNEILMLEKNIRAMSESYLDAAQQAVQGKRGGNIEKYKASYEEATMLYQYINSSMYQLNNQHFKNNATSYQVLMKSLQYLEIVSSLILVITTLVNVLILTIITKNITKPLTRLADSAYLVGEGNFDVEVPQTDSRDEVGVVTRSFNKMVQSLKEYVKKTRESMENERRMQERELLMETHLKDAQLKYLQSQINPHFLFNSLNAGAQLAMMEDAEQTCLFIERMADFFRYNVKKISEDATLREEIEAVDNYVYVLNVRFAGDIHFEKSIDATALEQKVPSMLLQPLVENAVNHGIRNVEWEGQIQLTVQKMQEHICISVRDNGQGMTQERIEQVLKGELSRKDTKRNSTGIGLDNVIHRLELYYNCRNLMEIKSEGLGKGTEILIWLPVEREEEEHVSDLIGG